MGVPNQVQHRQAYRERKAAGKLKDRSRNRHKSSLPRPVRPQQKSPEPPKENEAPTAERLQLNLPTEPEVAQPVDKPEHAATANVEETAVPEVHVDPPTGEGELPPVGEPANEPVNYTPDGNSDESPLV